LNAPFTHASTAVIAPAKINLALHVVGRRDDGYHLIDTLVAFTRFGDRLTIGLADVDSFAVSGPFAAGLEADTSTLVLRARDALRTAFGPLPSVAITLEKNLPVASGIGGGSSDAAAALRTLARLWSLPVDADGLARIGLALGADVPMCIASQPTRATGIGEQLHPLPHLPPLGIVLVNSGAPVSTAAVFGALAQRDGSPLPDLPASFEFHTLCNWLELTRNDLQEPAGALEPSIGRTIAALRKAGGHFVRMSGSGATCFGLFESGNLAKRAATALRARHPDWFVAATRPLSLADVAP
jgi:4-diphosphocytidyl-2-C-methyl-D-erythritol kinase